MNEREITIQEARQIALETLERARLERAIWKRKNETMSNIPDIERLREIRKGCDPTYGEDYGDDDAVSELETMCRELLAVLDTVANEWFDVSDEDGHKITLILEKVWMSRRENE